MQPTPPPPTPNPVTKGDQKGDHDGNGDSHTDETQTYETDYYGWLQQQIDLIRQEKWDYLDSAHLLEELESLGRQEQRQLVSHLTILIAHLLKWEYQPSHRSYSWQITVRNQRREIRDHLAENPSLKPYIPEALRKAYPRAVDLAEQETQLIKGFPKSCPFSFESILDPKFLIVTEE